MQTEEWKDKKIAVLGVGGVGGYVGALLADVYPNVSFVVRGDRAEAIRREGLYLESDYRGARHVHPRQVAEKIQDLEPQDYIFVCVKNYSLEDVCADLAQCIGENTVIVPIMNGVDPGERVQRLVTRATVVHSLIYIVSFLKEGIRVVQQGDFANMFVGIPNADAKQTTCVNQVCALLAHAGIDCETSDDIQRQIWRKYVLNAAYNVETAYYDESIGRLREDEKKAKQYESLIQEAYEVGVAKGVHLYEEDVRTFVHSFYHELKYDATSSLQRDFQAGRRTELETFCGYLVKEGRRLGIDLPVTQLMYEGLKKRQTDKENI